MDFAQLLALKAANSDINYQRDYAVIKWYLFCSDGDRPFVQSETVLLPSAAKVSSQ